MRRIRSPDMTTAEPNIRRSDTNNTGPHALWPLNDSGEVVSSCSGAREPVAVAGIVNNNDRLGL
jgi:hypothetical protein